MAGFSNYPRSFRTKKVLLVEEAVSSFRQFSYSKLS